MCKNLDISIRKGTTKNGNEYLYVKTPYSGEFVAGAKKLNGKWIADQKEWAFDPRDEERVRELCRKIYGTDGATPDLELVTVRLHLDKLKDYYYGTLELFGRVIARRPGRDSRVRLDNSVVIVAGGFPTSGGSVKNPALSPESGTILEVRDVPRSIVRPEDFPEGAAVILPNDKKVNVQALKDEAVAIRKRLAEILEILEKEGETI